MECLRISASRPDVVGTVADLFSCGAHFFGTIYAGSLRSLISQLNRVTQWILSRIWRTFMQFGRSSA
jgi:hypothetical protein